MFFVVFEELFFVTLFVGVSLIDPPIIFLFFTKLVFRLFFENKLRKGLSHDRNIWEKIRKDTKRWQKMAAVLKNAVFM